MSNNVFERKEKSISQREIPRLITSAHVPLPSQIFSHNDFPNLYFVSYQKGRSSKYLMINIHQFTWGKYGKTYFCNLKGKHPFLIHLLKICSKHGRCYLNHWEQVTTRNPSRTVFAWNSVLWIPNNRRGTGLLINPNRNFCARNSDKYPTREFLTD